jgi:hypothetical protein
MRRYLRSVIFVCSVAAWAHAPGAPGGGEQARAGGSNLAVSGDLSDALHQIGQETGQMIGLVTWRSGPSGSDNILPASCTLRGQVEVNRRDLAAGLNAIVSQCSDYKWLRLPACALVVPKRRTRTPLGLQIARYTVAGASLGEALDAMFGLPEFQAWARSHNTRIVHTFAIVAPGLFGAERSRPAPKTLPPEPPRAPRLITLNLRSVKLLDVLNAVAQSSGASFWRVAWLDENTMGVYVPGTGLLLMTGAQPPRQAPWELPRRSP